MRWRRRTRTVTTTEQGGLVRLEVLAGQVTEVAEQIKATVAQLRAQEAGDNGDQPPSTAF